MVLGIFQGTHIFVPAELILRPCAQCSFLFASISGLKFLAQRSQNEVLLHDPNISEKSGHPCRVEFLLFRLLVDGQM